MKPCSRCKIQKILNQFSREQRSLDGRRSECKTCQSVDSADYYIANRKRRTIASAAWYAANRQRKAAVVAAYSRGCTVEFVYECWASHCVICGVSPTKLAYYRHGRTRRMQVGHLVPGDDATGHAPMCWKCNGKLSDRTLTAQTGAEVLRHSRKYWIQLCGREEAWLHTDVDERGYGVGGQAETPGRQAKLNKWRAGGEEQDQQRAG